MSGYCEYCEQTRNKQPSALFGDTSLAGGIPHRARILSRETLPNPAEEPAQPALYPSIGPVYLDGRLVLSLSFRLRDPTGNKVPVPEGEPLLERYRIWDDSTQSWLAGSPCILRFETADVVMHTQPRPAIAWTGAVDVRLPVIGMPDLDDAGIALNSAHRLRWKRYAG